MDNIRQIANQSPTEGSDEAELVIDQQPEENPKPASTTDQEAPRKRRLLKTVLPTLLVAGGLYARGRFQHSQTFLPEEYPNGIWNPENYGVDTEDVWFHSEDGVALHAWWIPTRRARGTVLYCHGNAGNITNRIGVYRFLRRIRVNILAFDYRGYGRSEGKPSERGVFLDAVAAYDHLLSEIGESQERVVFLGHSLGGAVAIDCATKRPASGLIVQSTFTDLKDMARIRFPSLPMSWVTRNQFRNAEKVQKLVMPKLFIHGTADETIPFALGERLYDQAADPKEWYPIQHAGHNDIYRFGGVRYLWKLARFVKKCLKETRARG